MLSFRFLNCSLAILGMAIFASNASADIVVLSGLDTNSQFNVDGVSTTGHVAFLGSPSGTQTFSVAGLAVNGLTIDVDFTYLTTTTGGTLGVVGNTAFSYGVNGSGDPPDNEIDPGETLTFSSLSADYGYTRRDIDR